MLDKNKLFGGILGVSHFFTDAIASFILVSISLVFFQEKANIEFGLFFYFMLYNFIAFWWQSVIWYFLDKIKNNKKSFKISKFLVLISFLFYLIWLWFLIYSKNNFNEFNYIISVIMTWLGSAFFHIWWWNISLLSEKKKASVLWLFASGWVIWLSFWYFLATYYYNFYIFFFIILTILWIIIYLWKSFKLEKELKDVSNKHLYKNINVETFLWKVFEKYIIYFTIFLLFILALRSSIWTNFQYVFYDEKIIILYLAISAFLWKFIWWFLEDNKNFKDEYFLITWIISLIFIIIYSFIYKNLFFILVWIFGLTLFISPVTIILNKIFYQKKAIIISYSFWLSLILGYFIYLFFS